MQSVGMANGGEGRGDNGVSFLLLRGGMSLSTQRGGHTAARVDVLGLVSSPPPLDGKSRVDGPVGLVAATVAA